MGKRADIHLILENVYISRTVTIFMLLCVFTGIIKMFHHKYLKDGHTLGILTTKLSRIPRMGVHS